MLKSFFIVLLEFILSTQQKDNLGRHMPPHISKEKVGRGNDF